ncbi:MAG: glycosyltransferase family 4 protein [Acidobacteriia bacterium]|jgi:glycosyltransferase involved in cell wall biosynthesis|nr:glycosyltransferase family 4 protein [Terriglobia bacterium]
MKLIWFSHFLPYPPVGGAAQRSYHLIRQAAQRYQLILVLLNTRPDRENDREAVHAFRQWCAEVHLWSVPFRWKGVRWWAGLAASVFDPVPFNCRALWSPALESRWRQLLDAHPDALVHFDSSDLALYFPGTRGRRAVLNHHNCESAMALRRAELEPNPLKKAYLSLYADRLARLEAHWCSQFAVNLVVSERDGQLLRQNCPEIHTHVVANGTDTEYFTPPTTEPERGTAIFAASFGWYPNLSAARYLQEIWPRIEQQWPGARLYLAGKTPPQFLLAWAQRKPNITVVANPPDIRPWMARAAVFICPIRDGGGTRLKILDAMAQGKAVVSTSLGCEGLDVTDGKNILIADDPESMAAAVVRLWSDDALRRQIVCAGRELVERRYSWHRIGEDLHCAYRCAETGLCPVNVEERNYG